MAALAPPWPASVTRDRPASLAIIFSYFEAVDDSYSRNPSKIHSTIANIALFSPIVIQFD